MDAEREFGWQYPSQETLMTLQANRGLARSMLGTCEVREIILKGDQTEDEQKEIIDWHYQQLARDQVELLSPSMWKKSIVPLWMSLTSRDSVLIGETTYGSIRDLDKTTMDDTLTGTSNSPASSCGGTGSPGGSWSLH